MVSETSPLCACGCSGEVARSKLLPYNWNKFVLGHNVRNRTQEEIENLRKSTKNNWQNPEVRIRRIEGLQIAAKKPEIIKKRSESIKRTKNTPEGKRVSSEAAKESLNRPEVKEKFKKIRNNPKYLEKLSKSLKIAFSDPEFKEWQKQHLEKIHNDPEIKQRQGETLKETYKNKSKLRKQLSEFMIANWQDPEFIKKVCKGRAIRPNKPEIIILDLLNELYPNEWKYTGDFSFMINGKNPDFTNVNGQKKVIEFFGEYFHTGGRKEERERKKDIQRVWL